MCNTQIFFLLNQHNGDDAPEKKKRKKFHGKVVEKIKTQVLG